MPRVPLATPERIYGEIRKSNVYEDRLEYSVDDLESSYSLTTNEAQWLYRLLHAYDTSPRLYDLQHCEWDNRDGHTTWLKLPCGDKLELTLEDMFGLIRNIIENLAGH